ncbi:hypothetical protein ACT3R7_11980 [Halomonas sp. AOP43-A1-21]
MSLSDYALSRSIKQAAAFFEVAGEVAERGIEMEQCDGYQRVSGIREGFEPSEQWKEAVWDFYVAISHAVKRAIEVHYAYEGDGYSFDSGEIRAWVEAKNGDKLEPWGWVHRAILLMNHARRINDVQTDMGDPEFHLIKQALRQKIEGAAQ